MLCYYIFSIDTHIFSVPSLWNFEHCRQFFLQPHCKRFPFSPHMNYDQTIKPINRFEYILYVGMCVICVCCIVFFSPSRSVANRAPDFESEAHVHDRPRPCASLCIEWRNPKGFPCFFCVMYVYNIQ